MSAEPKNCEPAAEAPDAEPLSRLPIVAVGLLVLLASAVWLSCHEYDSGGRPPEPGPTQTDARGNEPREPAGTERKVE